MDRDEGWPVAFHGTSGDDWRAIKDIVRNGFKVRGGRRDALNGEVFGSGVYCTPEPDFAAHYAEEAPLNTESGHTLQVVFQVRVRPGCYRQHDHRLGKCWVVPSANDIRPCGILLRED